MTESTALRIGPEVAHILESDARLHGGWADVQNRWALLLLSEGRARAALSVLERCLEINPRYAWAAVNRVQVLAIAGDSRAARGALGGAALPAHWLRPYLEAFLCLAEGDGGAGRKQLAALDPEHRDRPDVRRLEAALATRAGDSDAASLWSRLVGHPHVEPRALVALLALARYGEGGAALTSFVPGAHQLYVAAGRMEARMGNLDTAGLLADAAYCVWSDRALHLNQRAFVHELRDENAEAVALYREASQLAPEDPASFISLAYFWSAQGELGEAFESLATALERAPRYADLHHQMGLLRRAREEHEEALASFRKALEINPRYLMARLDDAMTLIHLGRWRESLDSFEVVLASGLRSADVLGTLGKIHRELGDRPKALVCFLEARSLNENDPEALYGLGEVLFEEGSLTEAGGAWRRFLDLEPEGERTESVRSRLLAIGELQSKETET